MIFQFWMNIQLYCLEQRQNIYLIENSNHTFHVLGILIKDQKCHLQLGFLIAKSLNFYNYDAYFLYYQVHSLSSIFYTLVLFIFLTATQISRPFPVRYPRTCSQFRIYFLCASSRQITEPIILLRYSPMDGPMQWRLR